MTRSSSESFTREDKRSPTRSRRESPSPEDRKQASHSSVGQNAGKEKGRPVKQRTGGAVKHRRRAGTPGTMQCRHCWRVIDNNTTSRQQHAQSQYCIAYQYKNAGHGSWAACVELAKADLSKASAGGLLLKERPKSPEQGPRQVDKSTDYEEVVVEPEREAKSRPLKEPVYRRVSPDTRRSRSVYRGRDRHRSLSRARSSGLGRVASRTSRTVEPSRTSQSDRKAGAQANSAAVAKAAARKTDAKERKSMQTESTSGEYYEYYSSESPDAVEKTAKTVTPAKGAAKSKAPPPKKKEAETPAVKKEAETPAVPAPSSTDVTATDVPASTGTNRREDLYNSLLATALKTVAGLER